MILTGKCKEDFINWCQKTSFYTDNSNHQIKYENSERGEFLWYGNEADLLKEDKFLNALIIEYFDSIGVYISINITTFKISQREFNFEIKDTDFKGYGYLSRQEATEKAIEKANDLINKELTINL